MAEETERLKQALIAADAAGDTESARQIAEYIRSTQTKSDKDEGFFSRVGEDLSKRGKQIGESFERYSFTDSHLKEKQGVTSTALQTLGAGFGAAGDIMGQAGVSAFRALPDSIEQPIRETSSDVFEKLSQTKGGESALRALQKGSKAYEDWKKENPVEAANVESVLGIASVTPALKPAGQVTKGAVKTGMDAAREASGTVGRGVARALPMADEAIIPLAKRAKEFDIPLRFDQIKPSQLSETTQKVSQAIPFSGTNKFEALQSSSWNKALAKTLGVDDLKPKSIKRFREKNSKMFDDVLSQRNIEVSADDLQSISDYRNVMDDMHGLTARDVNIVSKQIDDVLESISAGENKGQTFSSLRNRLLKKADRAGDASPAYYDLVDLLDDVSQRSMSPDDIAKLYDARKQYKYYKTIQKTLAGEPLGEVNPTKLMSKVASSRYIDPTSLDIGDDPLVDLARIGKELLKKQGGSDTFEKTALGATGAAVYYDPTVGFLASGAMAGNRGLQSGLLRNQGYMNQMIERSPVFKKPNMQGVKDLSEMSPEEYMRLLAISGAFGATPQEEQ